MKTLDDKTKYKQLVGIGVATAKEMERQGISQAETARMAGISRNSLTNILECEPNYRINTLLKVFDVLGLELYVKAK